MQAAKVRSSQFLFLNVPSVSWFDWHPISIASVTPGADNLSQDVVLHLKALGGWSKVSPHPVSQSHMLHRRSHMLHRRSHCHTD
jgi:hypothetical protein